MSRPCFGEKLAQPYKTRVGVYVVIANPQGQLVLVQAPNGAYLLPGGEIEVGETRSQALHRELLEELGFTVTAPRYLGVADEYFYSKHRQTYFYNPGYFYGTDTFQAVAAPLENFNQIEWCTPAVALEKLKRGSHRWAVQQWQQQLFQTEDKN